MWLSPRLCLTTPLSDHLLVDCLVLTSLTPRGRHVAVRPKWINIFFSSFGFLEYRINIVQSRWLGFAAAHGAWYRVWLTVHNANESHHYLPGGRNSEASVTSLYIHLSLSTFRSSSSDLVKIIKWLRNQEFALCCWAIHMASPY